MSDNSDNPSASYAYQRRGDLPSEPSDFYRDTGLSKEAFEVARSAQIAPDKTPERFADCDGSGDRTPKIAQHNLPQPSPDFAPPNRKLYKEDGF